MQEDKTVTFSKDQIRPLVIRSLRRSNIRKKIAEYLFEISPSGSYTSEIAYSIKTTPTNVIGAIRGMGERYKEDESLIDLGIVEQVTGGKNVKIYKLTELGKEIIGSIKTP
jgi:predicted transcriptional regulator with HTH domain